MTRFSLRFSYFNKFYAKITVVFSVASLVFFYLLRRFIINDSFESAIYGLEELCFSLSLTRACCFSTFDDFHLF